MYPIKLNYEGGVPVYRQIVDQIKQLISTEHLNPGDELPTIRKLALALVVNPNTIAKAYKELEYQGIIHTKRGIGCFVSERESLLSDEERKRILKEHVSQLVSQAKLLNFNYEEIRQELEKQYYQGK